MSTSVIVFIFFLRLTFCQNANSYRNSYYFKMGKNNNEFKVNNRVYFLNHNITDYEYPNQRVEHIQTTNESDKSLNYDVNYYLDDEWNYVPKNLIKPKLPLFIHKFYEKRTVDSSITHKTRILFNINSNSSSNIIQFNLDSLKMNEVILDADLYFYWPLKNTSRIYKQSVVLRLYQFEKQLNGKLKETNLTQNPDIHKLFNVIYVSKAQKGWQTFRLKKPIDNWLNGEENLGLLITISSYDENKLIEVFNDTNGGIYRTFANIMVQKNDLAFDETQTAAPSSFTLNPTSQCYKKEWNISFTKLGWVNFIISPKEFQTYDCAGKCEYGAKENNNHVKLLKIFHKRLSCCVPIKYIPLPIMYYDKFGNVVINNYENVIVTDCGCR